MKTEQITVKSPVTGKLAPALLLRCRHCEGEEFILFCLHGDRQLLHLQCTNCEATYCQNHVCGGETA
jgi:hypothetical protein